MAEIINRNLPENEKNDRPPQQVVTVKTLSISIAMAILITAIITSYMMSAASLNVVGKVSPENCYVTGKGLPNIVMVDERATAVLHIIDQEGKVCTTPVHMPPTCELVSELTGEIGHCTLKKMEASQYELSYQPTSQGGHLLHIKVENEHIEGSPFVVTVLGSTPVKIITGVKAPQGIAFNHRDDIIVVEYRAHCVSIISSSGEKRSFGSKGSGQGQFYYPCAVAVDGGGNVLVADGKNHRIQKFTPEGKYITGVGKHGTNPLEFDFPVGIGIHPHTKNIYITENMNHRIQILNPDLTFNKTFGSYGQGEGQFNEPKDVAFDSIGNVYVADNENHRIQVFTPDGQIRWHIRMEGKHCKDDIDLSYPSGISIDSNDVLYVSELYNYCISVFDSKGELKKSFGTKGNEPGQFDDPRGIAVDKNGSVYVSDHGNDRIQIF